MNASPFFAAQKLGKPGAFPQSLPEALALWLADLETAQPTAGALWGSWVLPHRPTGSGEAEGAFPSEPPEALALWLSVPEIAQPIAGTLWGYGHFRIISPGMGAVP